MYGTNENAIEWLKDEKRATVTFTQGRMKSKIRRLAEKCPGECQIVAENEDGSICAHVPVKWIKVSPPRTVSEEQIERSRERMNSLHANHVSKLDY